MLMAGGHVSARYTLIFLPLLAVALAAVLLSLVPRALRRAARRAHRLGGRRAVKTAADLELARTRTTRNRSTR